MRKRRLVLKQRHLYVVGDLDGVVVLVTRETFRDYLVGHARPKGWHVTLHDARYGIAGRALLERKH